jgi:hypothetical protein
MNAPTKSGHSVAINGVTITLRLHHRKRAAGKDWLGRKTFQTVTIRWYEVRRGDTSYDVDTWKQALALLG